jgi:hypothetical protein
MQDGVGHGGGLVVERLDNYGESFSVGGHKCRQMSYEDDRTEVCQIANF